MGKNDKLTEKMTEKKFNTLYLVFIILIIIGLIVIGVLNSKNNESDNANKEIIEILDVDIFKTIKLVPFKLVDSKVVGYSVSELNDRDINDLICTYIYNNADKITVADGFMMEKAESVDKILSFLGLKDREINTEAGNTDIRFTLEKVTEDGKEYYKLKKSDIATDAYDVYEYKLLDTSNLEMTNKSGKYVIYTEVVGHMGGGPNIREGKADIYVNYVNGVSTLEKVVYHKYEQSIVE